MVPPLVGVAVNVTLVPAQIVVAEVFITTLAGRFGLTLIVTLLDATTLPVVQVALDVNTTEIISPLTNAEFA